MTGTPASEAEVKFVVTYDGPDVTDGRMDVKVLAPAMMAVAKSVDDAARFVYGPTSSVRVDVNADFRHGSFSYELLASPDVVHMAKSLLHGVSLDQVKTVLQILGLTGGGGVIGGIRWLRNRRVSKVEPVGKDEAAVTTGDGESKVFNVHVANLMINPTIRGDVYNIVQPLERANITEFRSGVGPTAETVITKDEVALFQPPPVESKELMNKVQEELVEVVSINFRDSNKWRVALAGDQPFWATILDEDFLAKVRSHTETFGAGDALRVAMRTIVTRDVTGEWHRTREIVQVLEKIPPEPNYQASLLDFMSDERNDGERGRSSSSESPYRSTDEEKA